MGMTCVNRCRCLCGDSNASRANERWRVVQANEGAKEGGSEGRLIGMRYEKLHEIQCTHIYVYILKWHLKRADGSRRIIRSSRDRMEVSLR